MITITSSILAIKHDAQFGTANDDIDTIIWYDDNPTNITAQQILDKQEELQAEYDALQYQRDREPEYPSMADQLDYIYHNGIAKWKSDMIKPVKDAHPKP